MWHISPKTGSPTLCRARKTACPLGGAEDHFPSKEAAQDGFSERMAKVHGATATLNRKELARANLKEAHEILSNTDPYDPREGIIQTLARLKDNPYFEYGDDHFETPDSLFDVIAETEADLERSNST